MAKTLGTKLLLKSCQKNQMVAGWWSELSGKGIAQGIFGNFDKNKG